MATGSHQVTTQHKPISRQTNISAADNAFVLRETACSGSSSHWPAPHPHYGYASSIFLASQHSLKTASWRSQHGSAATREVPVTAPEHKSTAGS